MGYAADREEKELSQLTRDNVLLAVPLYNHGKTVKEVARKALATGYRLLVVDDGSSDGGLDNVRELDCDTVRLDENSGKGAAILEAARFADEKGFAAILTIDADGQHEPQEAEKLVVEAMNGSWPAVIIGSREMDQDDVPGSSRFGMHFSNFWVRLESGRDLDDTQSGMRLYPVKQLLELDLTRKRYDFEIEVLVKCAWAGLDIRGVPVTVHYPPATERVSHFDKLKDNWRLTRLHSSLVFRRLLPLPNRQIVPAEKREEKRLIVKNPWQTLKNLCLESSSPFWLAVSVWIGIFLGALPLLACHTIVIIYVCYRLQLNKIAAVAASQFCMPPLVPALCIEIGYFIRSGQLLLDLSWERWLLEIHQRIWDWLLGSLIAGPLLGFLGAGIVYTVARSIEKRKVLTDD